MIAPCLHLFVKRPALLCLLIGMSSFHKTTAQNLADDPLKATPKVRCSLTAGIVFSDAFNGVSGPRMPLQAPQGYSYSTASTVNSPASTSARPAPSIGAVLQVGRKAIKLVVGLQYTPSTNDYKSVETITYGGMASSGKTVTTLNAHQFRNYFLLSGGANIRLSQKFSIDLALQAVLVAGTWRTVSGSSTQTSGHPAIDTSGAWYWYSGTSTTPYPKQRQTMKNNGGDLMTQIRLNYDLQKPVGCPIGFYLSAAYGLSGTWGSLGMTISPFHPARKK